jgi:hypothetical protein
MNNERDSDDVFGSEVAFVIKVRFIKFHGGFKETYGDFDAVPDGELCKFEVGKSFGIIWLEIGLATNFPFIEILLIQLKFVTWQFPSIPPPPTSLPCT